MGNLRAQEKSYAFTANSNFPLSGDNTNDWQLNGYSVSDNTSSSGYISPAVEFYKKDHFQAFEISRIGVNTTDAIIYGLDSLNRYTLNKGGVSISTVNVAVRYTYAFLIGNPEDASRLKFYLGAAAGPYFERQNLQPLTSDIFPASSTTGGVKISAIPALRYSFADHWFLNVDVPLTLADFQMSATQSNNPAIPVSDRKTTTSDFDLFPFQALLRFGVGLRV